MGWMAMEETMSGALQRRYQRAAAHHRRALWWLVSAGEQIEVRVALIRRDLDQLWCPELRTDPDERRKRLPQIIHTQSLLAAAEAERARIIRATYAHLQALRWLRQQVNAPVPTSFPPQASHPGSSSEELS